MKIKKQIFNYVQFPKHSISLHHNLKPPQPIIQIINELNDHVNRMFVHFLCGFLEIHITIIRNEKAEQKAKGATAVNPDLEL